jgi:hypothetical protein
MVGTCCGPSSLDGEEHFQFDFLHAEFTECIGPVSHIPPLAPHAAIIVKIKLHLVAVLGGNNRFTANALS